MPPFLIHPNTPDSLILKPKRTHLDTMFSFIYNEEISRCQQAAQIGAMEPLAKLLFLRGIRPGGYTNVRQNPRSGGTDRPPIKKPAAA
jgi:hypothetical protein